MDDVCSCYYGRPSSRRESTRRVPRRRRQPYLRRRDDPARSCQHSAGVKNAVWTPGGRDLNVAASAHSATSGNVATPFRVRALPRQCRPGPDQGVESTSRSVRRRSPPTHAPTRFEVSALRRAPAARAGCGTIVTPIAAPHTRHSPANCDVSGQSCRRVEVVVSSGRSQHPATCAMTASSTRLRRQLPSRFSSNPSPSITPGDDYALTVARGFRTEEGLKSTLGAHRLRLEYFDSHFGPGKPG